MSPAIKQALAALTIICAEQTGSRKGIYANLQFRGAEVAFYLICWPTEDGWPRPINESLDFREDHAVTENELLYLQKIRAWSDAAQNAGRDEVSK